MDTCSGDASDKPCLSRRVIIFGGEGLAANDHCESVNIHDNIDHNVRHNIHRQIKSADKDHLWCTSYFPSFKIL